jgi:DNA ligase 1
MELAALVALVSRLRATTKKTEKVALIAEQLRQAREREIELVALYLTGTLTQGRIGIGYRSLQNAMPSGPAVGEPLTLRGLDEALGEIARQQGQGSTEHRARGLRAVLERTDPAGREFLFELLTGEVRQGALDGLVLEAIAKAAALPATEVRQAAMFAPGIGALARAAIDQGSAGLARFSLQLLSPVAPMLANPAEDAEEALGRLGEAAFEYKVDGVRMQVHRAGDEVRVFTRHLQDVTARVPEVVEWARALPVREVVVEGEAIALRADGRPRPFQETMRRLGRRLDVETVRQSVPLSSFFFDLLYLGDEGSLVARPYAERVERLKRIVSPEVLLPRVVTRDPEEAERFFEQAVAAGHEGLMAKSLAAPYAAGQRGFHWLKLKPHHTLDLVILAVERGSGRRTRWLSNLHLGARDEASGQFVMLGKTFKGLTDEMLEWQTQRLTALQVESDGYVVRVRPELVAEIAFSDVQESPRYPAGLALRLARVKRYRPDKPASEADTLQAVRAIFERQRA